MKLHTRRTAIAVTLALGSLGAAGECGAGAPNAYKLHHARGSHQCQSQWNIGYYCSGNVEIFDATDCTSGHARLRNMGSCCAQVIISGKQQVGGRSINYTPGACSPLF